MKERGRTLSIPEIGFRSTTLPNIFMSSKIYSNPLPTPIPQPLTPHEKKKKAFEVLHYQTFL